MSLKRKIISAFKLEFEKRCFILLIGAYNIVIAKKSISLKWNENDITEQLNHYISDDRKRINWFIVNNIEHRVSTFRKKKGRGFADKYPRIDLRFTTISSYNEYQYFFEAKNLREKNSKLKRRYINTGINNYITGRYPYGSLVGYLLNGNLNLTIKGINSLLKKDNRTKEILQNVKSKLHSNYYESYHPSKMTLKHLFFDFTL